jgi:hypothetical protein
MTRRDRSDSHNVLVGAFQQSKIQPPAHFSLTENQQRLFDAVISSRERASWTETDILLAVQLAYQLERLDKAVAEADYSLEKLALKAVLDLYSALSLKSQPSQQRLAIEQNAKRFDDSDSLI